MVENGAYWLLSYFRGKLEIETGRRRSTGRIGTGKSKIAKERIRDAI